MGFKKEIQQTLSELVTVVKDFIAQGVVQAELIAEYKWLLKAKDEQIQGLLDRLMARDIPELKTFALPEPDLRTGEYRPEEDESLAGEVVGDMEDVSGKSV